MALHEILMKMKFLAETKGLDVVRGKLGEVKTALGSVTGKLGLGGLSFGGGVIAAAGVAAGVFAAKMRDASAEAFRIGEQLKGMGVTTGKGFAVVEAFENVGKGADQAIEAITKAEAFRTKAMQGEANMAKAAGILGLNIEKMATMDAVDILKAIGDRFKDGATSAEKWAAQVALGEQALRNVSALGGIGGESTMAQYAARWGSSTNETNVALQQAAREVSGFFRAGYEATISNLTAITQAVMGDFDLAAKNAVVVGINFDEWARRNIEAENARIDRERKLAAEEERIARAKQEQFNRDKALADYQMDEELKRRQHEKERREASHKLAAYQIALDKEAAAQSARRSQLRSEVWAGLEDERLSANYGTLDASRLRTNILASSQAAIGGRFGATIATTDYASQQLVTLKEMRDILGNIDESLSS